jgi:hypothetical protein
MGDVSLRLLLVVNLLVPLLLFMAAVYLGLHILFARLIHRPDSPVLWFFAVVTGPLTRPVRALLPAGIPEPRVRTIALAVYVLLWIAVRIVFLQLVPVRSG